MKTLEEILKNEYVWIGYDWGFQAGRDSMKEEILKSLPPKDKARWGSENQTDYIQYEHGFNSCLNQVKDIIKHL